MSSRAWKLPGLPLLLHIQETNNDSAGKRIGPPRTCLPVCLLAINPPTQPWIINAAIYPSARPANSQEREWATSWWCGSESVAMPLWVSPSGLLKGRRSWSKSWLVQLSIKVWELPLMFFWEDASIRFFADDTTLFFNLFSWRCNKEKEATMGHANFNNRCCLTWINHLDS